MRDRVLKRFPDSAAAKFIILGDCNDSRTSRALAATPISLVPARRRESIAPANSSPTRIHVACICTDVVSPHVSPKRLATSVESVVIPCSRPWRNRAPPMPPDSTVSFFMGPTLPVGRPRPGAGAGPRRGNGLRIADSGLTRWV